MPDEDLQEGSYLHWEQKPVIGRRGLVLAVVVPVLIAAAAFGVVSWVSEGSQTQATTTRVPTSSWKPGQTGGSQTIRGQLSLDAQKCVYLADVAGQQVWTVWPAGYYARIDASGRVSLYDGGDHLVAREGETVQASGQLTDPTPYEGQGCVPSTGQVAVVQSDATKVG
ncbi:hypothetical protein [Nocardioides mangrovi]|uniref:DUF5666 domain-containing protein n=1 Tax=Nocardioides mangrovi TaxID=2874580 RepID=A0ABS7UGN6_9ACTN|nr:hypothetical protein [Nocardioides mangrovi]MBZ5740198.1 hypothetical protein [Nocardioides mangrovi]